MHNGCPAGLDDLRRGDHARELLPDLLRGQSGDPGAGRTGAGRRRQRGRNPNASRAHLKTEIPRLKRRAVLLSKAITYSTTSAIVTSLIVIVAFACAYLNIAHEYGVAPLFIIALAFFAASLVNLARETSIALHEMDHQ
jgi:hypothetical protein